MAGANVIDHGLSAGPGHGVFVSESGQPCCCESGPCECSPGLPDHDWRYLPCVNGVGGPPTLIRRGRLVTLRYTKTEDYYEERNGSGGRPGLHLGNYTTGQSSEYAGSHCLTATGGGTYSNIVNTGKRYNFLHWAYPIPGVQVDYETVRDVALQVPGSLGGPDVLGPLGARIASGQTFGQGGMGMVYPWELPGWIPGCVSANSQVLENQPGFVFDTQRATASIVITPLAGEIFAETYRERRETPVPGVESMWTYRAATRTKWRIDINPCDGGALTYL